MLLKNKVNTTNKLNIVLCNTMHFGLPIPYFAELFWLSNTAERTYKKSKKGIYLRSITHISSGPKIYIKPQVHNISYNRIPLHPFYQHYKQS